MKPKFNFRDAANLDKIFAMLNRERIFNCTVNFGRLAKFAVVIAHPAVYLFWYDGDRIRRRRLLESVFRNSGYHEFKDIRINRKRRVVVEIATQYAEAKGSRLKPDDRPYLITLEVPLSLLKGRKKK